MSALLHIVRQHRAGQAALIGGQAAVEEQRRAIRRSLAAWCRICGYEPAAHHQLLIHKLEALTRGDIQRLAIFMPPGSAKSTYASILYPAWHLANSPHSLVLGCSHTTELAKRFGRRVRNLIDDHELILGISPSDETAADRWRLHYGGEYKAASVGTGIAGFRADLVIIDGPIRSREDADSEAVRDGHWEWYWGDVNPRVKPDARWILIQSRWHEDDLAGRILEASKNGGDHWEVISLPAEAEDNDPLGRQPGEFLWEDGEYGYARFLRQQKANQLPRNWTALYQQKPAPDTGDYFKSDWLKPYDDAPPRDTMTIYGASDYAVTDDGGDYTVHVVVGVDPEGRIYLLDVWRAQTSSEKWVEALCDLVIKWKPVFTWAEEGGQIKAGIGPFLQRRMRDRKAYVARQEFPTRGDKARRAQSIRGRMASDGLYVPTRAPWYAAFRAEMLTFPAGKHDDQVDALGLVGQLLDQMVPGRPAEKPEMKEQTGYAAYRSDGGDNYNSDIWGL